MIKTATKILVFIIICGALAFSAHFAMDNMMDMDGMPASCLDLCISQAETGTPASTIALLLAAAVLLIVCYAVCSRSNSRLIRVVSTIFHQDRHRYLMKTSIMLR